MSRLVTALIATTLALALAAVAAAAEGAPLEVEEINADSYPEVTVVVTAPRPLVGQDLPNQAFGITENGEPREITIRKLPSHQLEIVLLLDTSGSMSGAPLAAAKSAAVTFVQQMPPGTRVAVIGFGSTPVVASPFSTNVAGEEQAIQDLQARGETALYDALLVAVEQFSEDLGARRSIVLLSDGGDTVSSSTLDEAIAELQRVGVKVYGVELQSPESDSEKLARLAETTGGRLVPADDPDALAGIYQQIASELINQYELTFRSEARGPAELRISLSHAGVTAEAVRTVRLPAAVPSPEATPAAEPEPVVVEPEPTTLVEPTVASRWPLFTGAAAFFLALAITLLLLFMPSKRPVRLAAQAKVGTGGRRRRTKLSRIAESAVFVVERALERQGRDRTLNSALERAGVALRPAEFVVLLACGAVTAMAIGTLLSGRLLGLLLAAVTLLGSRLALSIRASRRRAAFADQLGDTLQLLAGTLRSGYGVLQAIDILSQEAEPPTSEELRRVVLESRLGRDFIEGLHAMADRLGSQDFEWVTEAIDINREVGGDLAEVLDKVAATIRDRNQIRRQVKALSAEGRLSAIILLALPFVLAAYISIVNPDYFAELTTSVAGRVMMAAGGILMVIGTFWMRRVVNVEY
ncbi:MAG: VWA domain-containing protein [Acidimicrobiia bacterium]